MRGCMMLQMAVAGISPSEYEQGGFIAGCIIQAGSVSRNAGLPGIFRNGGTIRNNDAVNDMRRSVEGKY